MSGILTLDLSKSNTGWALWDGESCKVRFGSRKMGEPDKMIGNARIKVTEDGLVFARVHSLMSELAMMQPYGQVYLEKPIDPARMQRTTGFDVPWYAMGLAAHVHSYCVAKSLRCQMVDLAHWRKNFIGNQKRGTKSKALKTYTIERARSLGFAVRNDDEADAIGIMDFVAERMLGRLPPWRAEEVLRREVAA